MKLTEVILYGSRKLAAQEWHKSRVTVLNEDILFFGEYDGQILLNMFIAPTYDENQALKKYYDGYRGEITIITCDEENESRRYLGNILHLRLPSNDVEIKGHIIIKIKQENKQ